MSAAVSLTQMIALVRRRADIVGQTGFISDDEITGELNSELQGLYDTLVQHNTQEFFRKTWNLTTNVTDSVYILPPDFYRLISVDATISGFTSSLAPINEEERNAFKWYPGWNIARPSFYRLLGAEGSNKNPRIQFFPDPGGSFAVAMNYYPTFTPLVQGGDVFDGINGWEDVAIWKVVASCKDKGNEDPSYAMGRAGQREQQITALADSRDTTHAERVHDSMGSYEGMWRVR